MKYLFVLVVCGVLCQYGLGQVDMGMTGDMDHADEHLESPTEEHKDHSTMSHDEHGHEHDEHGHDHDEHGHHHDDEFIPHCDCVIRDGIDCSQQGPLEAALQVLQGSGSTCLNECKFKSECQNAFWVLHAYHEICPTLPGEPGAAFHDFVFGCLSCIAIGDELNKEGPLCEEVECGDIEEQNALVDQLLAEPCVSGCATEESCQKAWLKLSSHHECLEVDLGLKLITHYHDFELECPPACVPDTPPINITAVCEGELDEIELMKEHGTTTFDTITGLDVVATLDPTGMERALVQVFSEALTLAPNAVGQTPVDGEGHLQYYVDGELVSRLYCPHAWVSLAPGLRNITVTAHANDYSVYTHGSGFLSGHTMIVVPESNQDAAVMHEMSGNSSMGGHGGTQVWHSDTPPQVALTATRDFRSGYNFQVTVDGFDFAPESVSLEHEEGMGHVHYSIDGQIGGMIFCDVFHLDLAPGEHTIGITLNANTHDTYVDAEGNPLSAETTVMF
eukprot:TRINITY_DN5507_c0_g1_i4.p1 TRINITY_DN5507_c0_g1~~TRINITY_DN5507_c0_g1_i4.p1  ORF type:complete len:504 (-),score=67.40 TRINITY_DN5507_c0_g1_i4:278-1789(-)